MKCIDNHACLTELPTFQGEDPAASLPTNIFGGISTTTIFMRENPSRKGWDMLSKMLLVSQQDCLHEIRVGRMDGRRCII